MKPPPAVTFQCTAITDEALAIKFNEKMPTNQKLKLPDQFVTEAMPIDKEV